MTIAVDPVQVNGGTFADYRLSGRTLAALDQMDIQTPTPIQAEAIPALMEGHDVIGQARTGSGKTLAFAIPALEVVDPAQKAVQVLVLTPTRELANQVASVFEVLAAGRGIKVGLLFGGRAEGPQRIMLKQGVHVIVGTPGRVLDMINQGALWLDKVRFLVLDEADEMLDQGFAPDVERILARTTSARQTALFSATVPDWVQRTAQKHLVDPVQVRVDANPEDVAPIDHVAYDLGDADKISALKELLDQRGEGSMIVFGRTKHGVKKLARQLEAIGYPVAALQGNLSQNARDEVMANFRSGRVKILLATNVAARGLDISHVEQVINYELPESPQLLTHRIGRTGRMGRQGKAITLLAREDGPKWRQLERGLGRKIPRAEWQGAWQALNGPTPELREDSPVEHAGEVRRGPMSAVRSPQSGRGRSRERVHRTHQTAVAAHRNGGSNAHASSSGNGNGRHAYGNLAAAPDVSPQPTADSRQRKTDNRQRNTGNGQRTTDNRQRTRVDVECQACGIQTTVPFQPTSGRPVYCRECYTAIRGE